MYMDKIEVVKLHIPINKFNWHYSKNFLTVDFDCGVETHHRLLQYTVTNVADKQRESERAIHESYQMDMVLNQRERERPKQSFILSLASFFAN